jgi:hypothetical protein
MRGRIEPILLKGGGTVKALAADFLADLQEDWRKHGAEVFRIVREKYPQVYFTGMVTLSKIVRWETGLAGTIDKPRTPEEIIAKLEEQAGPEARKLFERFLRQLNKLQEEQQQQQMHQTESPSGGSGGDAIERALAVAARYRGRSPPAR